MAVPSYTSFDNSYFLGNNTTITAYGEDLDCEINNLFNQTRDNYKQQQQQQQQQCHYPLYTLPQETDFLTFVPSSYCHPLLPSDPILETIHIPGTSITATTTTFSPFSSSDDSLYSFSPKNDSFFGPPPTSPFTSAAMASSSLTDPYVLDTMYYHDPSQQQQADLLLNDLLMFQLASFTDTNEVTLGSDKVMDKLPDVLPPPVVPELSMVPSPSPKTTSENRKQARRPRIHRCSHCPHTSNRANNMKEHILTHNPNRTKQFSCQLCGKRFARKHDMKRHAKSPHPPTTMVVSTTVSRAC